MPLVVGVASLLTTIVKEFPAVSTVIRWGIFFSWARCRSGANWTIPAQPLSVPDRYRSGTAYACHGIFGFDRIFSRVESVANYSYLTSRWGRKWTAATMLISMLLTPSLLGNLKV